MVSEITKQKSIDLRNILNDILYLRSIIVGELFEEKILYIKFLITV